MNEAAPPSLRRRPRWALRAGVGGAALIIGAGLIILGPGGPVLARTFADGATVWRLGRLDVEGVGGSGLGDLRVVRATLSDDQGVWARAENLRLHWKPLSLVFGQVALTEISAARLQVLRQPTLAPARGGGTVRLDTDAPAIGVASLELADGVAGPAARFSFAGALRTRNDAIRALHLDLKRLDNAADAALIDFRRDNGLRLEASIDGEAGGVFAHVAGAPDKALRVRAQAGGGDSSGSGALNATLGDVTLARGALRWTAQGWRGEAIMRPGALPATAGLASRFGQTFDLRGSGDAPAAAGSAFQATLASEILDASARGRIDSDLRAVGAVAIDVRSASLPALSPELGFTKGGARFNGAVEFEDELTRFSGRLGLTNAQRDGFDVTAEGPVEVFVRAKDIRFTGDLVGGEIGAPDFVRPVVAGATLRAEGLFDRTSGAFRLSSFRVRSPHATLAGQGDIDDGETRFAGTWDVASLGLLLDGARGAGRGTWTLRDTPDAPMTLKAEGAARQFAGYEPIGPLLGPAPKIEASLRFTGGGTLVEYARATGARIRLGARGRLVGDTANLQVEASARGPARIGGVSFAGAADATGTLTGKLGDPTLSLNASLASLTLGGAELHNVVTTLDLAPTPRGRRGRVGLEGQLLGLPASASADLALGRDILALENLEARWAQVVGAGRAQVAGGAFSADARLSGMLDGLAPGLSGAVSGSVTYANAESGDQLNLDLRLRGARIGALAADEAAVKLAGPLDAMKAQIDAKGWADEQAINLAATGDVGVDEDGVRAALTMQGQYAGAAIATRGPLAIESQGDVFEARGAATLGAGAVEFSWRSAGDDVAMAAKFDNAPLDILTAALEQPAAGALSGEIRLAGARQSLGGDADLTFTNARLARRSRDAVNAHLTAQLGGGQLRGAIDARSGRGLEAKVEMQVPMIAQAAPFQLTPVRGSALEANWTVAGPIEGLWALFGPLDQSLGGQVDGQGAVRFANGGVTGDGRMVISGGTFDDKFSGVKLREIDALITFDEQGVSLARFNATDGKAGRVTGTGRLNGQEEGTLDLKLSNVVLADRPDAHATGDGDLELQWRQSGMTLSGEIRLDQADVRVLDAGVTPTPLIDVIEINRPGPPPRASGRPTASVIPAKLDLRIVAPGRAYTRTRGLEAEWSLDLRLVGDLAKPSLFGEARLVRGDFNLAGRRFELERGVIRFSGAAEDAEIDVAATATSPELTAQVALTGRALDPQIALSSDPVLPEDEILPELLFGRSSRELSGFEAAQLAASLATLAGQSAFDIAGVARAAVNLDRLEVREDSGGVLVAGGKYLSRDVYVEVTGGALGRAGTAVEWQVRPRLFIISSFLTNGDQRLAVRWRQEY